MRAEFTVSIMKSLSVTYVKHHYIYLQSTIGAAVPYHNLKSLTYVKTLATESYS